MADNKKEEYTLSGLADWVKATPLTRRLQLCWPDRHLLHLRSASRRLRGPQLHRAHPWQGCSLHPSDHHRAGRRHAAVNSAKVEKKNADAPMYNMAGQRCQQGLQGRSDPERYEAYQQVKRILYTRIFPPVLPRRSDRLEELTKLYYRLLQNYQNTFYEEKIIIMALR